MFNRTAYWLLTLFFISSELIAAEIPVEIKDGQLRQLARTTIATGVKHLNELDPKTFTGKKMASLIFTAAISEKVNGLDKLNPRELLKKNNHKIYPLVRISDKSIRLPELDLRRNNDRPSDKELLKKSYLLGEPYKQFSGELNVLITKALWCDIYGFDLEDLALLLSSKTDTGSYRDTHVIAPLLILRENNCISSAIINPLVDAITQSVINAQNTATNYSDLYAQRIFILYWAGYGNHVKAAWIEKIINSQNQDSGWGWGWGNDKRRASHPHPTVFSLLSLIYFLENQPEQAFYPIYK